MRNGRPEGSKDIIILIVLMVLIVIIASACAPPEDGSPKKAVITVTDCEARRNGNEDCFTVIRFEDGTTLRRRGIYGQPGDSLVAFLCPRSTWQWCSWPTRTMR